MPACDISEMEQPPCQPCRKAGDRALPPFGNTDTPSNRRQLARKELPRRCRLLVPRDSSGNELAHVPALMLSDGSQSGERSSIRPDNMGRISDDVTLGISRKR